MCSPTTHHRTRSRLPAPVTPEFRVLSLGWTILSRAISLTIIAHDFVYIALRERANLTLLVPPCTVTLIACVQIGRKVISEGSLTLFCILYKGSAIIKLLFFVSPFIPEVHK